MSTRKSRSRVQKLAPRCASCFVHLHCFRNPVVRNTLAWQGCNTHGEDIEITDPAEQERVIGGEVTVWSERLDPAIMLATAFPRAAAAAERLWSPRAKDILAETAAARPRLEALRCFLLDRGLGVSALSGGNEASNFSLPSRPLGPRSQLCSLNRICENNAIRQQSLCV
eukprot:COSAG02_NODE_7706_length_2883_cov_1.654095_3_plen_169_part_00